MSLTVTTTQIISAESLPIKAYFSQDLLSRVKSELDHFFLQLQEEKIFTNKTLKEIADWYTDLQKDSLTSLKTKEELEEAALSLCSFICVVIRPEIAKSTDRFETQFQLLNYEDELIAVMKLLLPKENEATEFLESYEKMAAEESIYNQKLDVIEKLFDEQMKDLCNAAEKTNEAWIKSFDAIKERLLKLNENNATRSAEFNARLITLTAKVQEISAAHIAKCSKLEGVSQKLADLEKEFEKILK